MIRIREFGNIIWTSFKPCLLTVRGFDDQDLASCVGFRACICT